MMFSLIERLHRCLIGVETEDRSESVRRDSGAQRSSPTPAAGRVSERGAKLPSSSASGFSEAQRMYSLPQLPRPRLQTAAGGRLPISLARRGQERLEGRKLYVGSRVPPEPVR